MINYYSNLILKVYKLLFYKLSKILKTFTHKNMKAERLINYYSNLILKVYKLLFYKLSKILKTFTHKNMKTERLINYYSILIHIQEKDFYKQSKIMKMIDK